MTDMENGNKILLVEDDEKLSKLLKEYLESNGYSVSIESRGDTAGDRITTEQPNLVILDIMLPGKDGRTVCKEVRPYYKGPIVMLTALGDETDEVVGLELGADDYISKPAAPRLLLSRIHSLLRRTSRLEEFGETSAQSESQHNCIVVGTLVVDAANRIVKIDGEPLELTTAEFDLLYYLALNPGKVMSRDRIYQDVRGIEYDGIDRSIDLRIARLRKKLGDDGKRPQWIKSVRGSGYLLVTNP